MREELHARRPRVLVVDDNETNRLVLEHMIDALGGEVELACDGREAVGRGEAAKHDVILMDLAMPVMDGHEATRSLRALGVTCPIIAVTAHMSPSQRAELAHEGFTDLIQKPVIALAA